MSICNLDHFAESYWQDKKFVLVGGCFDPLHEGHLAYFTEARKLGPLVCCVAPDDYLSKKRTPFLPELTRLKVLNACSVVEHVTLARTADVIRALKPSHYVVGDDYADAFPDEDKQACLDVTTRVVFASCRENSSTALLADYERRRNAEKLAQFESFVQGQKPASKPWEPVTDYSWEARSEVERPHAQLIKDAFQPPRVIDVGCGLGHLVFLLRNIGVAAFGIDCVEYPEWRKSSHFWIETDVTEHDLFDSEWGIGSHAYDLVICREVLEHLTVKQLAIAVRNLVKLSSRYCYVTTRFTPKSHLLDVDGSDDLDPTHQSMLNIDFLRALFVLEGCRRRPDLEERLDWQKKGRCLVYEVPRD